MASALTTNGPQRAGRSSYLASVGLSPADAAIMALAVLLVVGYFPPLFFDNWTLRMALLAVGGLPGLAYLALAARSKHPPSMLLAGFVAWALVASMASGAIRSSVIGDVGRELSWISLALIAGLWSLGRTASTRCRDVLPSVVLVALAFGAVVGIAQTVGNIETGQLALYGGRPTGLVVNPVYFGALCAAGSSIGLAMPRVTWWSVAAMALCAHAASLSGSRVAVGSVVLVTAIVGAKRRTRVGAAIAAANVAALASGALLARIRTPDTDIGSRLAAGDGGGRSTVWRYGLEAWWERPIQGHGVGRFRAATQGRFSSEFASQFASDERTQAWFDPHNALVNVLVASGVIGLALAAAWSMTAGRAVRGPLAWGAMAIALTWLLQPMGLATVPIAMLLFGVAAADRDGGRTIDRHAAPVRAVLAGCLTLGAVAGGWLVVGDLRLKSAADRFDSAAAVSAASMYPHDPVVADLVAQIAGFDDDASTELVEHWRTLPTVYDEGRTLWWLRLARFRVANRDIDGARAALERASSLQPNSVGYVRVALEVAAAERDADAAARLIDVACEMGMPECSLEVVVAERSP